MSTSLAAFQRKEAKAAADAARAVEEERRVKDAIRQEEAARKKRSRAHCLNRCCKVRGCTRLVLLLVVLGAFLTAAFYFPTQRRFGQVIILPVGAVFFLACLVAILEESDTPTCGAHKDHSDSSSD